MRRAHRIGVEWQTPETDFTWEHVRIEVLMDIRGELRRLNSLLNCSNFLSIPTSLRVIRKNTTKPNRRKPKGKE